ncbi:MAG: lipopolysaccharide kinase InaA family protein [Phycisphaerae bacterium]
MSINEEICEPLKEAIVAAGLDTVEGAFAYRQGEDLHKPGLGVRRRTRIELTDSAGDTHMLFLKRYGRERFGARLRRRLTYGQWATPGVVEYANVQAVGEAGIPTMAELACGEDRQGRSFVLVTAVEGASLETRAEDFFLRQQDDPERLERFTDALAELAQRFHAAGFCHRDFYACHVFLDERGGALDLSLIDLARVFSPRWRAFRWRVKDLAQLKYSMPPRWVEEQWVRFLGSYMGPDAPRRDLRRYELAIARKVALMESRRKTQPYRFEPTAHKRERTQRTRRED